LSRAEQGDDVNDDVERLGRIGEAAERILRFSRDLVAYARPSTDIPGPVSLPDVIDKAIVFCEHEFSKSSVVVEKRLEPNLPLVRGIAGQLTQVFVNLFTNAAHAMLETGGVLDIYAERAVVVSVIANISDVGGGIATVDIEQIFEPFFTTKIEGVGTGLGLAIVRDIVTQHGGNLTASRRDGRGTVFTLHLPVVALPSTLRPSRK
jgi:signal transduction histidine kinase